MLAVGDLAQHAVAAFGVGAEHFSTVAAPPGRCTPSLTTVASSRMPLRSILPALELLESRRPNPARRMRPAWAIVRRDVRTFNVFGYITLRSVLATMTALVISFVVGPRMIRKLTEYRIGQAVRDDGPQTHLTKAGTPTMGGALILVSIVITTLLWADLRNRFIWVVLIVTVGFGAIGWVDDYRKVVYRNPKGLSARTKFTLQSLIGLIAAIYLAFSVSAPSNTQFFQLFNAWLASGFNLDLPPKADLIVPFFKTVSYPLGVWGFIVLSYCVIVGTSNAVNLTDGLDGSPSCPR